MDASNMPQSSQLTELNTQEAAELKPVNDEDGDVTMPDAELPPKQGVLSEMGTPSSSPGEQARNGLASDDEFQLSSQVKKLLNGKHQKVTKMRTQNSTFAAKGRKSDSEPEVQGTESNNTSLIEEPVRISAKTGKPLRPYVKKSSWWKKTAKQDSASARQKSIANAQARERSNSFAEEELEVEMNIELSDTQLASTTVKNKTTKPTPKPRERVALGKGGDGLEEGGANGFDALNSKDLQSANADALANTLNYDESAGQRRSSRTKLVSVKLRECLEEVDLEELDAKVSKKADLPKAKPAAVEDKAIKQKKRRTKTSLKYKDASSESDVAEVQADGEYTNVKRRRHSGAKSTLKASSRRKSVLLSEIEVSPLPVGSDMAGAAPEKDTDVTEDEIDVDLEFDKTKTATPPKPPRRNGTRKGKAVKKSNKDTQTTDDEAEESGSGRTAVIAITPNKPSRKQVTEEKVTNGEEEKEGNGRPKSQNRSRSKESARKQFPDHEETEEENDHSILTTQSNSSKPANKKASQEEEEKEEKDCPKSPVQSSRSNKPSRKHVVKTKVASDDTQKERSNQPLSKTLSSVSKELSRKQVTDDEYEEKENDRQKSTIHSSRSKKPSGKRVTDYDNQEHSDFEDAPKSSPKKARRSSKAKPATRRKPPARQSKTWDPIFVITDPKSPLTNINLMTILTDPRAWTTLHPTQQRSLLAHLPPAASAAQVQQETLQIDGTPENESLPNIPLQRLQSSSAFQTDVRQFQEDLRAGKLEPAWIEMAMNASARRRAGEFDDWKEKEREKIWGFGSGQMADGVEEEVAPQDHSMVDNDGEKVGGD